MKVLAKISFVVAVTALAFLNVTASIICLISIGMVALYEHASSIIEFSIGPLRAKLKEELSEAEDLTNKLRKFAAFQAKTVGATAARTGRWPGSEIWPFEAMCGTEAILKEMGVSEEDIEVAQAEFMRFALQDIKWSILGGSNAPVSLGTEIHQEYNKFKNTDFDDPKKLRRWLEKHGLLNDDRELLLEDMKWVKENGRFKDADQYLRSQEPVKWEKKRA